MRGASFRLLAPSNGGPEDDLSRSGIDAAPLPFLSDSAPIWPTRMLTQRLGLEDRDSLSGQASDRTGPVIERDTIRPASRTSQQPQRFLGVRGGVSTFT